MPMKAISSSSLRCAGILAGALLSLAGVTAVGAEKALPADLFPNYESYIKISGKPASVSGDQDAYRARTQNPESGAVGIEELRVTRELKDNASLQIDGRALTGAEDYLAKIHYQKNEVGSFDVGYSRFRTFYDGVGGFFPLSNRFMTLTNRDLHLDRGRFWLEGTFARPGAPVVTVSYVNELRSGSKDSTTWGSSDFTGLAYNLAPNPVNPTRKIAPAWLNVSERHQKGELTIRHTIGKVTATLTAYRETDRNVDTISAINYPGQLIPFPTPAAAALALLDPSSWHNEQFVGRSDGVQSGSTGITGKVETVLNEQFTVTANGAYQLVNADFTGNRMLNTTTPTAAGPMSIVTYTYNNLLGASKVKVATGNVIVEWKPTKDIATKVGVRYEEEYARAGSGYDVISATGTPAITIGAPTQRVAWSRDTQKTTSPVVEVRYTGIKNVALYATATARDGDGEEKNTSHYNPATALAGTLANGDVTEKRYNYTLGANWRVSNPLSVRGELFVKDHQFHYAGFAANTGDNFQIDTKFTGVKGTATVKPLANVTSTTRVVYQVGKMQVTGYLPTFPAYDSCDSKNYSFNETIDWAPNPASYVQLNGSLVFNNISTIYPRAGITPATSTVNAYDSGRVLQDSENNYVSFSAIAGWAVDGANNVELQATYYRADNGNAALAALTTPYGVATRDYTVTAGLKHKLNDRAVLNVKGGYMDSKNDTTGGYTNFKGPLAYVSVDYSL